MIVFENEKLCIYALNIKIADTTLITNSYIVVNKETRNSVIIDPAYNEEVILETIDKNNLNLKAILLTHCHEDHTGAVNGLIKSKSIFAYISEEDYLGLWDDKINASDVVGVKVENISNEYVKIFEKNNIFKLDDIELEIVHTPGHTKGSVLIYIKDFDILFSGDTIFKNSYGRVDLPSGSRENMKNSLDYIFNTFTNPLVFPGHDDYFYLNDSKRRIKLLFAISNMKEE